MIKLLKTLLIKLFLSHVTITGRYADIDKQFKEWKSKRNVFVITSYYKRAIIKKESFETFWYVEDNKVMRWCGMNQYKYKRNYLNGAGSDHKRQKD